MISRRMSIISRYLQRQLHNQVTFKRTFNQANSKKVDKAVAHQTKVQVKTLCFTAYKAGKKE